MSQTCRSPFPQSLTTCTRHRLSADSPHNPQLSDRCLQHQIQDSRIPASNQVPHFDNTRDHISKFQYVTSEAKRNSIETRIHYTTCITIWQNSTYTELGLKFPKYVETSDKNGVTPLPINSLLITLMTQKKLLKLKRFINYLTLYFNPMWVLNSSLSVYDKVSQKESVFNHIAKHLHKTIYSITQTPC